MDKKIDNNESRTITKTAFGIMAFLLGALGIHDFAARRYLYGCGHLTLVIVAIAIFSVSQSSFLPPTLFFGSWIWAIIENHVYQKSSSNKPVQSVVAIKKEKIGSFLAFARTAEIFTCIAIVSCITAIVMAIQARNMNCDSTSCAWSRGYMVVLPVLANIFTSIMSIFFIASTVSSRKELSAEQKRTKNVSRHTNAIVILGIILIIALIIAALEASRSTH